MYNTHKEKNEQYEKAFYFHLDIQNKYITRMTYLTRCDLFSYNLETKLLSAAYLMDTVCFRKGTN